MASSGQTLLSNPHVYRSSYPSMPEKISTANTDDSTPKKQSRLLNVKDALSYLERIKTQFSNQPEIYCRFLDIMRNFKPTNSEIQAPKNVNISRVIDSVLTLFKGYPSLIQGFNTFLPPGYKIELSKDGSVSVTNPQGSYNQNDFTPSKDKSSLPSPNDNIKNQQKIQSKGEYSEFERIKHETPYDYNFRLDRVTCEPSHNYSWQRYPNNQKTSPPQSQYMYSVTHRAPIEFNQAVNYVNKIKSRFASEPEKYKKFLEILQSYQREQKTLHDAYMEVKVLFESAVDLLEGFKQFLPENNELNSDGILKAFRQKSHSQSSQGQQLSPLKLSSKLNTQTQHISEDDDVVYKHSYVGDTCHYNQALRGRYCDHYDRNPVLDNECIQKPRKKTCTDDYFRRKAVYDRLSKTFNQEELDFFYECKKVIGDRKAYSDFLKLLDLFSQDRIKMSNLLEKVEPFLSKSPRLFEYFKSLIFYKDPPSPIYNESSGPLKTHISNSIPHTHSYRQLSPTKIAGFKCSGRDDLCREVLNDEWVSHPVYVSESGFVSHKKTQYEEALYRCEDERYDFDLNIESNLKTISVLEAVMEDIKKISPEERSSYKLSPDFCGTSRIVFSRTIKKIYSRDRGQDIINVILDSPYCAIPVVLKRLIQKNIEWMKAQRKWNRIWRKIISANYYKSLDYQGVNFRVVDRRAMGARNLVSEIETLYREQKEKRGDPLQNQRYQLDFYFRDPEIFRSVRKLLRKQLSISINTMGINENQVRKILDIIETFIPSFFCLTSYAKKKDQNKQDMAFYNNQYELADSDSLHHNAEPITGAHSWPEPHNSSEKGPYTYRGDCTRSTIGSFGSNLIYANNAIYVFFRLYQMLYSRLYKIKELSEELNTHPSHSGRRSKTAIELGLQKEYCNFSKRNRYDQLLHDIKLFLDSSIDFNEFENRVRNLFGISAYIMFTVDKLFQSLIKQIHLVMNDQKSFDLISQYYVVKFRNMAWRKQKSAYRQDAESIVQGETLYRVEYFPNESLITFQLLGNGHLTSREDKWSSYVEQFIQKDIVSETVPGSKAPFLRRNVRFIHKRGKLLVGGMKFKIYTKPELEIKICTNTYKMFFVENTEDLFYRKWFPRYQNSNAIPGSSTVQRARNSCFNYKGTELIPFTIDPNRSSPQSSDITWYEIAADSPETRNPTTFATPEFTLSRKEKFRLWQENRLRDISDLATSNNPHQKMYNN